MSTVANEKKCETCGGRTFHVKWSLDLMWPSIAAIVWACLHYGYV